jgi:hypothetical protein
MATVEIIIISGNNYDVYGTEADIKEYLAGRLGVDAYDAASSGDRKKAHVQATRWIDRQRWQSVPTDVATPQPLEFPRVALTDCNGTLILDTVVPDEVCWATAELVNIILGTPTASDKGSTAKNVKKVGAGSAAVEFFRAGDSEGRKGTPLPTAAWDLVKCFSGSGTGANSGSIASGTCDPSQFDDCDRYDLRQGEGFP